jgi:PAS domain S-box-containing protein
VTEPLRILLLEDNPVDAELNQHVLRKAGIEFHARRVERRDEFITALEEFCPDLVLADFCLPGFDGLQALALCRQRWPYLPFIIVSGALGEEAAVQTLHQGASDYLLKDRLNRLPDAVQRSLLEAQKQSDLQKTKRALEVSEARFRALVETSSDWIWEIDAQGNYSYCSPSVLHIIGYNPAQVLGMSIFQLMPSEEALRLTPIFDKIVSEHKSFSLLEWAGRHKDGYEVNLESSGTPLLDLTGNFSGFHGTTRDISERKRLAKALEIVRLREQEARENEAMVRIGKTSVPDQRTSDFHLRDQSKELFNTLLQRFAKTMDMALEQRILRVHHPIANELHVLAGELGQLKAGPRDVIDIYINALQSLSNQALPEKNQAYAEEGRLLALELMGNMVSFYKKQS